MLFSEIAPAFYERLDFVPVPLVESTFEVDRKRGGAPAMLVRSGDDKDLPAIIEMSAARVASARLALDRSEEFVRFGITKKRLLGPGADRHARYRISGRRRRTPGGGVSGQHGGERPLDDRGCGDRDPSGARLGAMLQVMLARIRASAFPTSRVGGRTGSCRRR